MKALILWGIGMSGGIIYLPCNYGNSPSVNDDHSHDGLWRMV